MLQLDFTRTSLIFATGFCLFLSACGYQPLYGTGSNTVSVKKHLSMISVQRQTTRTGQLVRNEIISLIAKNTREKPEYILSFRLSSKNIDNVRTLGSDVLRKSIRLETSYRLTKLSSGKSITHGKTFAHVSYDKTIAPFSNFQTKIQAQERAAIIVGRDIHTRLAAFFSSR